MNKNINNVVELTETELACVCGGACKKTDKAPILRSRLHINPPFRSAVVVPAVE